MLKKYSQEHLSDDEMLQALVDAADLRAESRAHLSRCVECQKRLDLLEQGFDRLEQTARQMTPSPSKPFRVPHQVAQGGRWRLTPMLASGVAAVLVLAIVLWLPRQLNRSAHIPHVAVNVSATGDSLIDQVDSLVNDPLPQVLQQLAISTDIDDTGNVIDWVVPSVDDSDEDSSWI